MCFSYRKTPYFVESHYLVCCIFTGGSLTKIAYYSTVSHRKVLYNPEKDGTTSVSKTLAVTVHVCSFKDNQYKYLHCIFISICSC